MTHCFLKNLAGGMDGVTDGEKIQKGGGRGSRGQVKAQQRL